MIKKEKEKTFFLTGVTGALGREILKALIQKTSHRLILLVRRKRSLSEQARVEKILSGFDAQHLLAERIRVLEGDVTLPGLGLEADEVEMLVREVDEFHHIAALTALNGSKEDCFKINVDGTREVLKVVQELHRRGKLKRFFYFSTAYVAGSLQTFCAPEDSLPEKPAHANFYEESKYVAESHVREAMRQGLPVTIFRPSIIVGNSKTGEVSEFNVIYPFMKLFAHGILSKLPTDPKNSFNIVPIDFVVDAALAIGALPESLGKTYHLVTKEPPQIWMLLELKEKEHPGMPDIQIIDPEEFSVGELSEPEQIVYEMLRPYLGYLNDHLTFRVDNTERVLAKLGMFFPKTDQDFIRVLLNYAIEVGYILTGPRTGS
ncbi:MAG: SDR family oxidoreductase [Candidatus Omnitrophota bacterium]